jgi:hypothetical protein
MSFSARLVMPSLVLKLIRNVRISRTFLMSRTTLSFFYRVVDETNDAALVRLGFDEPKSRPAPVLKEPLALAQDKRDDQQPILIDEVMLLKELNQITPSSEQDDVTRLLFQPGHFFHDIVFDERRIVPRHLRESRRNHVLGQTVKLVSHFTSSSWPRGGHFFIVAAPVEERVGLTDTAHDILVYFLICELEGPAVWRFHDPIQGQKLGYS